MPSPACEVKIDAGAYAPTTGGTNATPASTVTIRLISQADVRSWLIQCITTDELSDAAVVTAALVIDTLNKTATFTAPVAGRAYRFQSQINGGVGPNGVTVPAYTETFGIYTLTAASRRVLAADETTESDPVFGYITPINDVIRNPSVGGGEANTNSSVGGGAELNKTKVGTDLPLRTIVGALGTAAVQQTNTVEIYGLGIAPLTNAGTGALADIASATGGVPASGIRFTGAAPEVGSIAEPTNGRMLVLHATGGPLVLVNDAGGTAANRILTGTGANLTIADEGSATLKYDGTSARWRVISTSSAGGGAVDSVTADNGLHVTGTSADPVVQGTAGTCTLEMFEPLAGTGVTATDQAAWTAALAALAAGTYRTLKLGAKTYLLSALGVLSVAGTSIIGCGFGSVLQTSGDHTVLQITAENTLAWGFRVEGDNGTSSQIAVQIGTSGGSMPVKVVVGNVHVDNMYHGFRFVGGSASTFDGPKLLNCHVTDANIGISTAESAEYVTIDNCHVWGSLAAVRSPGSGIDVGSGNIAVSNSSFSSNVYGVRLLAGANDAHGTFTGCHFNHNASPLLTGAILYSHTFTGCHFYAGEMWLNGSVGPTFSGGHFNLDAGSGLLCNSAIGVMFTGGCRFATNFALTPDATSEVWFSPDTKLRDTNNIPANVGALMQLTSWAWAGDADDTLTRQESQAWSLIVPAGTISATRTITSARAAVAGVEMTVRNDNAQTVNFGWATGTTVAIPAGQWARIGARGGNAFVLENGDATGGGGGETNTASSSGGTASLVQTKSGVNLPFRGLSATSPVLVTQNTNDCTISLTGGTNGQFMTWPSGSATWGNTVTHVGFGTFGTTGYVRFPYIATGTHISAMNSIAVEYAFLKTIAANSWQIGDVSAWEITMRAYTLDLVGGTGGVVISSGAGITPTIRADGTTLRTALPLAGSTTDSLPFRMKSVSIDTGATGAAYTLSNNENECPLVDLTGSYISAKDVIFSNTTNAVFRVKNAGAGDRNLMRSGGASIILAPNKARWIRHNGTDYEFMEVP